MNTGLTRRMGRIALPAILAGIVVAGVALFGAFGSSSVCTRCGMIRHATDWQIPFTSVTLLRTSSELSTPVSSELLRSGVRPGHEHQWLFSSGAGNGAACAIGQGSQIQPVVQSDAVASVLAASQRFGEVGFRNRLLRVMFDPKTSDLVRSLGLRAPSNGFADAAGFRAWLGREMPGFEVMVTAYHER